MNKQNSELLRRIADPTNLHQAWFRTESKGAQGGTEGLSVEAFGNDLDRHLQRLRNELLTERYVPDPLQRIEVPKHPGSPQPRSEARVLGLPSVRDKVAQEAVRSVLAPQLEARFLPCSFGYRRGLGPQRAIRQVSEYLTKRRCSWAVLADIDDFFGSVDHSLLLAMLAEAVADASVLRLLSLWLKMGTVDARGHWRDTDRGIAQGGVLSPLLANLYLHPFDAAMTDRRARLVRYADDLLLLCRSRQEAERTLTAVEGFLREQLRLRLNVHPRPVAPATEGFVFLGIRFEGGQRLLDTDRLTRCEQRLADWTQRAANEDLESALKALDNIVGGWRRYYGALLGAGQLQHIDALLKDAVVRVMTAALQRGELRGKQGVVTALAGLVPVCRRSPAERRAYIADIAHQAVQAQRASSTQARGARSVAAAVRGRKRRHARRMVSSAELVVTTPGVFVGRRDGRVVVREGRKLLVEVPLRMLASLTLAHHGIGVSTDLLADCATAGIPVVLLEPPGRVVSVLQPAAGEPGAAGLRQLEALHDGTVAVMLATSFCRGKICNQVNLLKYFRKYRNRVEPQLAAQLDVLIAAMIRIRDELKKLPNTADMTRVRGLLMSIEGRAASRYWDAFGLLLGADAGFPGRRHQDAEDPVNQMLNYGYAILQSRVQLALLRAGLNPQVSFLHALQPGKPTLVYDLMEEFRAQVVDRAVLGLVRLGGRVVSDANGGLDLDTRRVLIKRVQQRLGALLRLRGGELKLAEVIDSQARLLAAHLLGKQAYRPFAAPW
ncbi:CRISPR-associated endonuclease Cas1 [Thiococcus pfennigii]|uniref:CRISPR-associated endonuclease Cas1 n=1 Tax=Thiococcus pfennigii TaxID=1057 RepID=UPI001904A6EF|nr:CRISPR-associated endonuclease Cas1 [Thiococcus pfennigii]MBK1700189.1 CRISPR-associated endonuclease Cas1 [Thiococcus pfennigii]